MDEGLPEVLREVVAGNAQAVDALRISHERLAEAAAGPTRVMLTRLAVVRVLKDLRSGTISTAVAQRWAAFMRSGYLGPIPARGVRPINIEWEDEDLVVEPLARMSELGDIVDGTMSNDELDVWIARLSL